VAGTRRSPVERELLAKHIGVADLKPIFPGFDNNPRQFPGLIKA
jgi:hypothetical protein